MLSGLARVGVQPEAEPAKNVRNLRLAGHNDFASLRPARYGGTASLRLTRHNGLAHLGSTRHYGMTWFGESLWPRLAAI